MGSDLALLWLRCRPAAVALIGPLAWESPYAMHVALKKKKKKKRVPNTDWYLYIYVASLCPFDFCRIPDCIRYLIAIRIIIVNIE